MQITEEQKEEQRRARQGRLMTDCSPIACYLLNKDFEVLDCNEEALCLFNAECFDDGASAFKNVFADDVVIRQFFDSALQSGYERFEWDFNDREDWQIPCEITFILSNLDNEDVIVAYVQDIRVLRELLENDINLLIESTEEKRRAEISEENNRSKSRFLASMSHEIRTPISAVIGISEIQLQNPNLPLEIEDAFSKVYSSANTLLRIVNDILDLSKIEAGKMTLAPIEYEIENLIGNVTQLCLFYKEDKDVSFEVNVDENVPTFLIGDDLRIKQILTNLLSNAFKYTEQGTVALTIFALSSKEDDQVRLVVNIRDTGRGMSEEQLATLFEEYARFHEHEARDVKGTGLGMVIAHHLISLMDAEIHVESAVGKGTSATLIIPQKKVGEEILGSQLANNLKNYKISRPTDKAYSTSIEPMPYGKVLVVDDTDTNIYVAKGLLSLYELQIETCSSGFETIEKVKNGEVFDIIFLDDMMPEMTGTEAVKILRDMGYDHPIVAFTANALVGQEEIYLNSGFNGFLSKPIQSARLNSILKEFIKDKQSDSTLEAAESKRTKQSIPDGFMLNPETLKRVQEDFVKTQANIITEIYEAVSVSDLTTACRLAHTLKGYAAMLAEQSLVNVSGEVEAIFKRGELPIKTTYELLAQELEQAISNASIES